MKTLTKIGSLCAILCLANGLQAQEIKDYIGFDVNYKDYLSKHDIVFQTPNYEGFEGLTIGNGDLGGIVWCNRNGIEMQINKSDLYDRTNSESATVLRGAAHLRINFGMPNNEWLYLKDFEARMGMFDATSHFKSETPFSNTDIKTWVDANDNVWVVDCDLKTFGELQSGTAVSIELERWGSRAFGGWYARTDSKDPAVGLGNAKVNVQNNTIYITEHFDGTDFVVACRALGTKSTPIIKNTKLGTLEIDQTNKMHAQVLVSVVTSNESKNLVEDAIKLLDKKEHESIEKSKIAHDNWWKQFWERSFVSIPNDYIENLYYYRRYLMASASRAHFPIPFNGGLFTWNHDLRNWVTPHHWNSQEQYWGLAVQNDCDLMLPYIETYTRLMPYGEAYARERGVDNALLWTESHDFLGKMENKYRNDMINDFTPASQIAAVFWEYYQFTGDKKFLKEKCYPFMKKAAEFYVKYLKWDSKKNEYYCFPTQPYENLNNQSVNSSTDRYMIEGLFSWCVEAATELHVDKNKISQWKHVLNHLWEPPILELPKIGKVFASCFTQDGDTYPNVSNYSWGPYHFGPHTTQIYPANIMGLDEKGTEEFKIAETVAAHQPTFRFAIAPGAIISARLGRGEEALEKIEGTINHLQHFPQGLFYNMDNWFNLSKYAEECKTAETTCQRDYIYDKRTHYNTPKTGRSGLPAAPFVQCGMEPMSIMSTTVSEMLIQSHEGKIRVFPAVPKDWNSGFVLRARNGFIVSSKIKPEHKVSFVGIESLNGNLCKIQNPWKNEDVIVVNQTTSKIEKHNLSTDGVISFQTKASEKYLVYSKSNTSDNELWERTYTGKRNDGPKYFEDASLGKKRDF